MAWYVSGRNCAALACMCSGVCLCVCVCVCVCSRVCAYVCVHFRSWWARRHQGCEYGLLKVCHTKWDAGSPYKTAEKLPLLHQHHHLCLTWVRTQLQARLLAQTSATIARTKTYTHKTQTSAIIVSLFQTNHTCVGSIAGRDCAASSTDRGQTADAN